MEAKKYLDNENIIFTGNPVRDIFSHVDREESRKLLNINTKEKFVFSFGGSGGQESTNDAIIEILNKNEKLPFRLTHVTGREHYEYFMRKVEKVPENVEILDYTHKVYDYLSSADLVIASSSAMTLAEISAIGIASLLIPKAYTAGNHQYFNAKSYSRFFIFFSFIFLLVFAIKNSNIFSIKNVVVEGNKVVSADTIKKVSGLKKGNKYFYISKRERLKKIKSIPYIKDAKISYNITGRVKVVVSERTAYYQIESNEYLIVDENFRIIAKLGEVEKN